MQPIKATFLDEITYDIPSQNWSKEQWGQDMDYMLESGIDTIVLIRGYFNGKCLFDSKKIPNVRHDDNFLEMILDEADKRNMKVFVGGYIETIDWNGDYKHEIEMNNIFMEEVEEIYGHHKSFYGWYIPHETGNNILGIPYIVKGICDKAKQLNPNRKTLLSPFFQSETLNVPKDQVLSPEQMYEEWDEIFDICGENLDFCAWQDASAPIQQVREYFVNVAKACRKHNIECWDNTELFEHEIKTQGFFPINFESLQYKINLLGDLVDRFMCFEFSHFMSPQSMFPSAKNLFNRYNSYYKK